MVALSFSSAGTIRLHGRMIENISWGNFDELRLAAKLKVLMEGWFRLLRKYFLLFLVLLVVYNYFYAFLIFCAEKFSTRPNAFFLCRHGRT